MQTNIDCIDAPLMYAETNMNMLYYCGRSRRAFLSSFPTATRFFTNLPSGSWGPCFVRGPARGGLTAPTPTTHRASGSTCPRPFVWPTASSLAAVSTSVPSACGGAACGLRSRRQAARRRAAMVAPRAAPRASGRSMDYVLLPSWWPQSTRYGVRGACCLPLWFASPCNI